MPRRTGSSAAGRSGRSSAGAVLEDLEVRLLEALDRLAVDLSSTVTASSHRLHLHAGKELRGVDEADVLRLAAVVERREGAHVADRAVVLRRGSQASNGGWYSVAASASFQNSSTLGSLRLGRRVDRRLARTLPPLRSSLPDRLQAHEEALAADVDVDLLAVDLLPVGAVGHGHHRRRDAAPARGRARPRTAGGSWTGWACRRAGTRPCVTLRPDQRREPLHAGDALALRALQRRVTGSYALPPPRPPSRRSTRPPAARRPPGSVTSKSISLTPAWFEFASCDLEAQLVLPRAHARARRRAGSSVGVGREGEGVPEAVVHRARRARSRRRRRAGRPRSRRPWRPSAPPGARTRERHRSSCRRGARRALLQLERPPGLGVLGHHASRTPGSAGRRPFLPLRSSRRPRSIACHGLRSFIQTSATPMSRRISSPSPQRYSGRASS